MKKINLFIVGILILFTSCSSDDSQAPDQDPVSDSKLLGEWEQIALSQQGQPVILTDCQKRSTIEFTAISYSSVDYAPVNNACQIDDEQNGTWVEDGENLTTTYSDGGVTISEAATFIITDDLLTILYVNDIGFSSSSQYQKI